jgi:hypothetical protein
MYFRTVSYLSYTRGTFRQIELRPLKTYASVQSAVVMQGDLIRLVYARRPVSKVFGRNYGEMTTLTCVNPR